MAETPSTPRRPPITLIFGGTPDPDLEVQLRAIAERRGWAIGRVYASLGEYLAERVEVPDQAVWTTRLEPAVRATGRPRKVTPEIRDRILQLRASGAKWSAIAKEVGLPSGTCRKVPGASASQKARVEKPAADFATPAPAPTRTLEVRPTTETTPRRPPLPLPPRHVTGPETGRNSVGGGAAAPRPGGRP